MTDRVYIFFIATYLAEGLVGVAYQPISYLLKDVLGLSAAQSAVFVAWMTAPLLLKPLLGMLTDAFPLGGRRRTPYLLLASAATSAGWAALATSGSYSYWPVLTLLTLVNVGMAFSDVLCDGVMVERGKLAAKTGMYQAVQIGTLYLTLFATGVGGGWLAEHASYRSVFALTAVFPLLIFLGTFAVPEEPVPPSQPQARLVREGLGRLLSSRPFWTACLVIFLFNFTPSQGTAFFYYQSDALGFSKLLIGSLTSASGLAGVLGAALFWKLYNRDVRLLGAVRRLDSESLLRWSVLAGAPLALLYMAYRGPASAWVLTALFGAVGVVMRLSLMDAVAKACPKHGEATAFALFMSVFNLSAWTSNTAGAKLYDALSATPAGPHGAMAALISMGALTTLACWPLLQRMPTQEPAAPAVPAAAMLAGGTARSAPQGAA